MYEIEVRYFNPVLSSSNTRSTTTTGTSSSSSSHSGSSSDNGPGSSNLVGSVDRSSIFTGDGNLEPLFQVMKRRIGVRHIELVQDEVDEVDDTTNDETKSTAFYFRINHVTVMARGANMIPLDVFQSRVTKADRQYMLAAAVEANMNMVRVWGGGKYEEEVLCINRVTVSINRVIPTMPLVSASI